jgi:hypothetical protein
MKYKIGDKVLTFVDNTCYQYKYSTIIEVVYNFKDNTVYKVRGPHDAVFQISERQIDQLIEKERSGE